MPKRPAGRPKASQPRDIRVTTRFTGVEADQLERLAGERSRAETLRACFRECIARRGGERFLPDTERALISRERRKAKRAGQTEDAALLENFVLEEPAAEGPPAAALTPPVPHRQRVSGEQVVVSEPEEVTIIEETTGRRGTVKIQRVTHHFPAPQVTPVQERK
jgi:hypothetical protein